MGGEGDERTMEKGKGGEVWECNRRGHFKVKGGYESGDGSAA